MRIEYDKLIKLSASEIFDKIKWSMVTRDDFYNWLEEFADKDHQDRYFYPTDEKDSD